MWYKLNPVGVDVLENTRNHLHKALQLVSAAARSYHPASRDDRDAVLGWDKERGAFVSKAFGPAKQFHTSLDIRKFIISLWDDKGNTEHLVLSGMSYPLAFGWMQVKLDKMGLNADQFNDIAPYDLVDYGFSHARDLTISEKAAEEYYKYYSNAFTLLHDLGQQYGTSDGVACWPERMDVAVKIKSPGHHWYRIGFSPGDQDYLEPYCYVRIERKHTARGDDHDVSQAIWHNKRWTGLVLLLHHFIQPEPEHERARAKSFFEESIRQLDRI
jgi:hypothetical protein